MSDRIRLDDLTSDALDQLYERLDRAEAAVARVRALHQPQPDGTGFPDGQQCRTCSQDGGDGYQYLVPWPCQTAGALGKPASAATQATDGCSPACDDASGIRGLLEHVGIDTTGCDITVAGRVVDAAPREHCGELMPTWAFGPRTECVLPPGHQGSHADDRGARWWYDPHGTGHS